MLNINIFNKNILLLFIALFLSTSAHAEINSSGLLDSVLVRYSLATSSWGVLITKYATWLFWTLVTISMVWTFGMLALRQADIGEFFAELIRFTIFTGFFWWLLYNGPSFAVSIYDSLRQIGGDATGLGPKLSPSGVVDVGFSIFDKVLDQSSLWSPVDSFAGITMAAVVLIILAVVGVNMLILLCSGWVLAYAGVFFLGFGGSRWTSEMAINYYKTVLGIAVQLMGMVLLVGIGKTFLDDYYSSMSKGISLKEMGVLLIVAVILLMLVNKIPPMLAGIVGGGANSSGIGAFGAGAAVGAAVAATGVGAAVMASGATNIAGGAQALMNAFSSASNSESSSSGNGMASAMNSASEMMNGLGGSGDTKGEGGAGESNSSPFSEAAGFDSSNNSGAYNSNSSNTGNSESSNSNNAENSSSDETQSKSEKNDGSNNKSKAESKPKSSGLDISTGDTGFMAGAAKAGRIAAGTAANLAQGVGDSIKNKASNMKDSFSQKVSESTTGKIASAIKNRDSSKNEFSGNSLSGNDEISDFVNKGKEK
ncbi:TPA: P-type conjugative transfer protein TrbL [Proteus mirabilis]|uniref:P-type conjugative transfer protein TrbL n=2 Tax=Proteus mirabilis TaxID=584 RepID=UPI00217D0846|nr:P-type conjugative transfer protein TrbL [Proteus mirabilis]MCS6748173.1 P-type conjugative transfer protein TrbL [Proteus mirabilis]HEK2843869.1 P-type conjugative transfer protein TrbL [Proteus mirabilis]